MTPTPSSDKATPRTDEQNPWGVSDANNPYGVVFVVRADFARQLERELAEAEDYIERLHAVAMAHKADADRMLAKAHLSAPSERIRACAEEVADKFTRSYSDALTKHLGSSAATRKEDEVLKFIARDAATEIIARHFAPPASPGGASR